MKRESDYDNDALDQSEAFFRKKKNNDDDTYFPPEESKPPITRSISKFKILNTNCREI